MTSVPHVTDILKRAGLVDDRFFTDYNRDVGTAVHTAIVLLDEGDLDWDSLDPEVCARVRQYQNFLDEVEPTILAIEENVEQPVFRYCGRVDRVVKIKGRTGVLDIKGPARFAWQAIQVALYAACYPGVYARWTLHLSENRYQLIEHTGRRDWEVAKAAITLAAWKEEHGN